MGPRTCPGDYNEDQHDVGQPGEKGLTHRRQFRMIRGRCWRSFQRSAAESADRLGTPDFGEQEENPERNQRPAQVRKVGSQVVSDRPLSRDVRKRTHNRQRPRFYNPLPTANQVNQHPGRKQREDGNDVTDGSGQRHQRKPRHCRQAKNGSPERAVRYLAHCSPGRQHVWRPGRRFPAPPEWAPRRPTEYRIPPGLPEAPRRPTPA